MYKNNGEVVNSFLIWFLCKVVSHSFLSGTFSGYCLYSSKKKLEMLININFNLVSGGKVSF